LECVFDEEDMTEMHNSLTMDSGAVYDSSDFRPVTDPSLLRIKHPSLRAWPGLLFTGFDEASGRFVPSDDLSFRYPLDWPRKDRPQDSTGSNNSSSSSGNSGNSSFDYRLSGSSISSGGSSSSSASRRQEDRQAAAAVMRSVAQLGQQLHLILARNGIDLSEVPAAGGAHSQVHRDLMECIRDIMGDVVAVAERCKGCAASLDDEQSMQQLSAVSAGTGLTDTQTQTGNTTTLPFEDSILRADIGGSDSGSGGGRGRGTRRAEEMFINWRRHAVQSMLDDSLLPDSHSLTPAGKGEATDVKAVDALDCLMSCYKAIDQMLQLRFQGRGLGYFETLTPHSSLLAAEAHSNSSSSGDSSSANIEATATASATGPASDADLCEPAAVFEVGQVLRHKKFGESGSEGVRESGSQGVRE
jgi:hypothetical protein